MVRFALAGCGAEAFHLISQFRRWDPFVRFADIFPNRGAGMVSTGYLSLPLEGKGDRLRWMRWYVSVLH